MLHQAAAFRHLHAHMNHNQHVIQISADNLARHSLPGAKAVEIAPYSFERVLGGSRSGTPGITHARHIPLQSLSGGAASSRHRSTAEVSANGNTIDPDQQLQQANEATLKLHEDMSIYRSLTELYKPFTSMGGR